MFEAKVFGVELLFCFFLPIFLSVTLYFNQPPALAIMLVKNFNIWLVLTFAFIISTRNIELFSVNHPAYMFFRGIGYIFFFTLIFDVFRGYNPSTEGKKDMGFASSTAVTAIIMMMITAMLLFSLIVNDFANLTNGEPAEGSQAICECSAPASHPEKPYYPTGEDCSITKAISCAFNKFVAPQKLDLTKQVVTPSIFYFWSNQGGAAAEATQLGDDMGGSDDW